MTDHANPQDSDDQPTPSGEDGGINDPLTRRDVEAPRAPFDAKPEESEGDA